MTNEVIVHDLTAADTVLMETAHSTYQFAVTNPVSRAGILSGGLFSENQIEANFLCSLSPQGDETSRIKVGSRAVFIYTTEVGTRYIVISAITKLIHTRQPGREKIISTKNYFYR